MLDALICQHGQVSTLNQMAAWGNLQRRKGETATCHWILENMIRQHIIRPYSENELPNFLRGIGVKHYGFGKTGLEELGRLNHLYNEDCRAAGREPIHCPAGQIYPEQQGIAA